MSGRINKLNELQVINVEIKSGQRMIVKVVHPDTGEATGTRYDLRCLRMPIDGYDVQVTELYVHHPELCMQGRCEEPVFTEGVDLNQQQTMNDLREPSIADIMQMFANSGAEVYTVDEQGFRKVEPKKDS